MTNWCPKLHFLLLSPHALPATIISHYVSNFFWKKIFSFWIWKTGVDQGWEIQAENFSIHWFILQILKTATTSTGPSQNTKRHLALPAGDGGQGPWSIAVAFGQELSLQSQRAGVHLFESGLRQFISKTLFPSSDLIYWYGIVHIFFLFITFLCSLKSCHFPHVLHW